jgi:DNA primase
MQNKELIKLVKDSADPSYVYNSLGLKSTHETSTEIRTKCPFHKGKNPTSFRFNKTTGTWVCFSNHCHDNASDLFGLVMKVLGIDFKQALNYVAELTGIDINGGLENPDTKKLLTEASILNFISSKKNKINHSNTKVYDESILKDLRDYDSSYFFMRDGFSEDTLHYFELGGSYIDNFGVTRSAIPIRNENQELVMITGRRIDSDDDPRYLPLEKGWYKGSILYNYHNAKNWINVYEGRLIIVEGFKGCWKMVQDGFFNTVACMGSRITEEQTAMIFKNTDIREVIIMLDGDKAGRKGNVSSAKYLRTGCKVTIILLPNNSDPSTLDKEDMFTLLSNKNNYFTGLINTLKKE